MVRRATLLTPFDPSALGNGSSRRAARWRDALASRFDVDVVVVPVVSSGPSPVIASASTTAATSRRIALPDEEACRAGAVRLMEPRWRDWMTATAPLPRLAAAAPAWLGRSLLDEVVAAKGSGPDVVVAFKIALAPMAADLALAAADLAGAAASVPLVVDLDDDEASLARAMGDGDDDGGEADALERLLRGVARFAESLDVVLTCASPVDAGRVGQRVGVDVRTVPNVVEIPALAGGAHAPHSGRALYVANFGYTPNRRSVEWLLRDVVPHLTGRDTQAHLDRVHLDVVGPQSERFTSDAVTGHGYVDDLEPFYAAASIALCPVLEGSGTSVKVLEALAHERAVVTTSVGARGLDVIDGEHLLVADDAREFADCVRALLTDRSRAAALATNGRALVAQRYSSTVGDTAMLAAVAAALRD